MHKPAIIGLNELKPKNCRYQLQECELTIEGYEMFHTLETERNRGICFYAHRDLKPSVCQHLNCDFLESVFVDCKMSDGLSLVVGLVYRSPGSTQENNDELLSLLSKATEQQHSNLIIMGDFNFPIINWRQGESGAGLDHPATKFLNATKDAFLIQHQTVPTRHREREKSNILDLSFSNAEDLVQDIMVAPAIGKSDHFTLLVNLNCKRSLVRKESRLSFHKADFNKIREDLQAVDWNKELGEKPIEDMWKTFRCKLEKITVASTPRTTKGRHQRNKWMDRGTLSVRKKHQLFRKWQKTKDDLRLYTAYIRARNW